MRVRVTIETSVGMSWTLRAQAWDSEVFLAQQRAWLNPFWQSSRCPCHFGSCQIPFASRFRLPVRSYAVLWLGRLSLL